MTFQQELELSEDDVAKLMLRGSASDQFASALLRHSVTVVSTQRESRGGMFGFGSSDPPPATVTVRNTRGRIGAGPQ